MSTERWCEWCRLRKDYLGWTNAHVAELAEISKITVDRIMSGNVKDLRNTTMQAVTKALVNGTWGQYPCAWSALSEKEPTYVDNPALVERCNHLQAALDDIRASDQRKIDFLKEQITFKEKQMAEKDSLLRERAGFMKAKDRTIAALSVLLGLVVAVIIAALVIDGLNPDVGFFWGY